ncbi:CoA ester lyase [Bradyrhizobium sp. LHD-71]|uniref:HpcH/HpaI aldolase/citrate lyase family protein n=1 Tax=Bradyrhizobium sp. LHD-71 TaxID=3072141 RepID=UPI0028107AC9|nr:CoA ester lyase [Bradyrhizobium sp. LHD-71]MDQ8727455.1 CoA ester lyase [Bradyrhizobium sp. LHD-71]
MRSLLSVPADRPRMLENARSSEADVIIYDLEDAVAPSAKAEARAMLAAHLAGQERGKSATAIRINGLRTKWCRDDIAVAATACPDYVMLPKVQGPEDLQQLDTLLSPLESRQTSIGVMTVATETVAGTLSLTQDAWRHPRLKAMLWGSEDLAADLGSTGNRLLSGEYSSPFRLARDLCLMAAKRVGLVAIDAVYTDFRDPDGLWAEAAQARRDGFDAKAAIHPSQVAVINEVFRPSAEEIAWAERVLAAFSSAGTSVVVVDGVMIDAPHAARARRILSLA